MKKYLFILLAAALTFSGCVQKPAEQQEAPAEDQYINITALTPEGFELSLSDLVGKTDYVLLDFWASWCGPCRRFVPVLKELYNSGMNDGRLQILSCSVDRDPVAWKTALSEENMPWPQMREDEQHMCSDKYEVQFIPHTVLIDREGRIVGVNLEEIDLMGIIYATDIVID